jgi:cytochrome c553
LGFAPLLPNSTLYDGLLTKMRAHRGSYLQFAAKAVFVVVFAAAVPLVAEGPPEWAYGTRPSPASQGEPKPHAAPDNGLKHVPGSTLEFTRTQINNLFGPADWFPGDHPKMPEVVADGRKPQIWACALCHYPNGKGRSENAGVSGLPVSYFIHQINDFKGGLRKSADVRKKNTNHMIEIAKAMTDEEVREAAEYFGAMKWTPWIKVVETKTVPKTRISVGMFLPLEGAGTEPIGQRIIEVPQDVEATETLRNPRSGFIAYVPVGSVKKGKALVTTGANKTVRCAICHGENLDGLGPVPGIAGRSPSYLVRQMYDMQQGSRRGEWAALMKPVVSKLSQEDMLNIAAYVSSQTP